MTAAPVYEWDPVDKWVTATGAGGAAVIIARRIQRKRTKGWRMPAGAVYVGRPTRWGNSAQVGDCSECYWGGVPHDGEHVPMTAEDAVDYYRIGWESMAETEANIAALTSDEARLSGVSGIAIDLFADLRGRDLVCWCPLDQPCHADVLLQLANR